MKVRQRDKEKEREMLETLFFCPERKHEITGENEKQEKRYKNSSIKLVFLLTTLSF